MLLNGLDGLGSQSVVERHLYISFQSSTHFDVRRKFFSFGAREREELEYFRQASSTQAWRANMMSDQTNEIHNVIFFFGQIILVFSEAYFKLNAERYHRQQQSIPISNLLEFYICSLFNARWWVRERERGEREGAQASLYSIRMFVDIRKMHELIQKLCVCFILSYLSPISNWTIQLSIISK